MPEDKPAPDNDGKRIEMGQAHEVRYWSKVLRVSAQRLRNAVREVGNSARKVRVWLNRFR